MDVDIQLPDIKDGDGLVIQYAVCVAWAFCVLRLGGSGAINTLRAQLGSRPEYSMYWGIRNIACRLDEARPNSGG